MFKIKFLSLFITLSLLNPMVIKAVENNPVLDSLITEALKANPDIIAADYELQSKKYSVSATGQLPDPQFSIGFLNLPHSSLSFNETPMSGISVGISQKFPWISKLTNQRKIAGLKYEISGINKHANQLRVIRMISAAYYEYSYWLEVEKIIEHNKDLIEGLINTAQTRYSNGYGSAKDVYNSQISLTKLEYYQLEIENRKRDALLLLSQLLDIDYSQSGLKDLKAHLPEISALKDPAFYMESAFRNNPGYNMSGKKTKLSKKKYNLSKAAYMPDLTIGVEYRFRENAPMDILEGEDFLSARLLMNLPLWFLSKQRNEVMAAKKMVLSAEAEDHSMKNRIEKEISVLYSELRRLSKSVNLYENMLIPRAESALESVEIAYRVDKGDFHELIDAQIQMLNFQLDRLKIVNDYNQTLAMLRELTGISFEE
ncbi:MAG: TolC family protein [candidate division Zixibacteria bacterium]|nr:TolC family protein [candidate division Zixibacteria bacterium]